MEWWIHNEGPVLDAHIYNSNNKNKNMKNTHLFYVKAKSLIQLSTKKIYAKVIIIVCMGRTLEVDLVYFIPHFLFFNCESNLVTQKIRAYNFHVFCGLPLLTQCLTFCTF